MTWNCFWLDWIWKLKRLCVFDSLGTTAKLQRVTAVKMAVEARMRGQRRRMPKKKRKWWRRRKRGNHAKKWDFAEKSMSPSLVTHIWPFIYVLMWVEEAERLRWPKEANERLHAVAQFQPWAYQVGEPGYLHNRDIQEGRRNVEAAGQRWQRGEKK